MTLRQRICTQTPASRAVPAYRALRGPSRRNQHRQTASAPDSRFLSKPNGRGICGSTTTFIRPGDTLPPPAKAGIKDAGMSRSTTWAIAAEFFTGTRSRWTKEAHQEPPRECRAGQSAHPSAGIAICRIARPNAAKLWRHGALRPRPDAFAIETRVPSRPHEEHLGSTDIVIIGCRRC